MRSIRFQLTASYVASLAALLLVFSVSIYEANVRMSESDLDEPSIARLRNVLMIGLPIALLAAAGVGYWLSVHAMGRVRAITRTARAIGETDLSRRLHLDDADEFGELARTFDAMLDRLEAAFQRQRRFTADAGHQLRTPVTIIGLEVQRALAQPRSTDAYAATLTTIGTEAERMAGLIRDLLILARADSGALLAAATEFDLSDLVLDVVERFVPLAEASHVVVDVEESPAVACRGNREQLTLVVSNLMDNAIKYTAGRGDRVRVSTGTDPSDSVHWAVVRVHDNGPGIPRDEVEHVFERFYRASDVESESDERSGHGLGLAIAQAIARAHGGEITAASTPGEGTAFELRLPRA